MSQNTVQRSAYPPRSLYTSLTSPRQQAHRTILRDTRISCPRLYHTLRPARKNPSVPEDFNEDDVYTARLTFYRGTKGTGGEVSQLVANGIGFVRGVSGVGTRLALDGSVLFQIACRTCYAQDRE